MKQFWRRFLQFPETRKNGFHVPYSDMDEVLQKYMASLPSPICVYLSPQHLLRLVPTQPRTTVTIWREAIQAGMLPRNISFETFREALMRLSPLFFAVSLTESNKIEQDTIISWQPWVSPTWRTNVDFCKIHNNDNNNVKFKIMSNELDQSSLDMQIFDIIPRYFVSTHLVQERIRFLRDRSSCTLTVLEWHQLSSPPFVSLLTWSDDHSIVRLSKDISFNVPADNYYGLKSEPNIFHQALNALAMLLPTFMVSENYVQSVYKEEFVNEQGVYHSVFENSFILRFPDARALLQHPDLQFTIQRNDNGGIMLHTNFLHTGRGVSNMFYKLSPSARDSAMTCVSSHVQEDQGEHQQNHNNNNNNNNYVRSVLNASLPYIPSAGDEVTLQNIRGEHLIGLQCTADTNNDHFSLTLGTVHGDFFYFQSTISSLHRLIKSGIPYSGLPREVHEALISAKVVKVVAIDSANVEECKLVEKTIIEIFRSCLNLNIKTVCNLWKLALFTGFPLRLPPAVSLSFYRRILLLRTGVTTPTTMVTSVDVGVLTPIALQIAICAVRLCDLCGIDSSNLNTDKLHRMILNDVEETWLIRNVELRIRRYGVITPQGTSLKSLQRQLKYLTLLYGPEVCIYNERRGERPVPLLTSSSSHNLNRQTDQVSIESEQITEEAEKKNLSEEKEKEEEEEYFSALCAETDVPSTEKMKNKNEGKITEDGLLTPEEEITLQSSKNTNNEQEDKEDNEENDNKENEEEEMYNAVFATDSLTKPNVGDKKGNPETGTILTTTDNSQKKNINTKYQNDVNSKSESLNFFLSPPSTHSNRGENLRGNHHKKNYLPPAYSTTQTPLSRRPNRSVSCKTPPSPLQSLSIAEKVRKTTLNEETMMQHHIGAVDKERDMIERLAQEIVRETQQSSPLRVRDVRNGNVVLNEKTMELMRELLHLNSSHR